MALTSEAAVPLSLTKITTRHGIVAIVDDDPQISRALGLWLELQDLRSIHHINGESLLHSIHQDDGGLTLHFAVTNTVSIPLVGAVLDLILPGITGIELAWALRRLSPALPIVLITALDEEERVRYGALPSGIHCLKKPFNLDALEDALFPLLD